MRWDLEESLEERSKLWKSNAAPVVAEEAAAAARLRASSSSSLSSTLTWILLGFLFSTFLSHAPNPTQPNPTHTTDGILLIYSIGLLQ